MFVKPNGGLRVIDPLKGDALPLEGREVSEKEPYWLRRLRDGSIYIVKDFKKAEEESKESEKKAKKKGGKE